MIGYEFVRRYAELVAEVFGQDEIVPPGITLEVDRPEWAIFKRETLWYAHRSSPALAANFSSVGVTNPVTAPRDRISVVMGVFVAADAVAARVGIVNNATVANGQQAINRDLRFITQQPSTLSFTNQQVGQQGGGNVLVNANTRLEHGPWILYRTNRLLIESSVVNQICAAFMWGYERAILPEEQDAGA